MKSQTARTVIYFIFIIFLTLILSLSLIYYLRHNKQQQRQQAQLSQSSRVKVSEDVLRDSKLIFEAYKQKDLDKLEDLLARVTNDRVLFDYSKKNLPHLASTIIADGCLNSFKVLLAAEIIDPNDLLLLHQIIRKAPAAAQTALLESLLLETGDADLNLMDEKGFPPLAVAVQVKSKTAINFLLQHQAKLNVSFANFDSILHYALTAVNNQHLDIIEILLSNGANAFKRGKNGQSAFHVALTSLNLKLIELFLNTPPPAFDLGIFQRSLVNHPTTQGQTPLHISVMSCSVPITKLLLAHGADRKRVNGSGMTPLQIAQELKHQKLSDLLLSV